MSRENDIVRECQRVFDEVWVRALKQSADNGRPVTCVKGCSACCSEPVYVNAAEARLIGKVIPWDERAGVVERTREWARRAKASGLLKQKQPHVLNWLRAGMVCPLLKDGLCLVYADRPLGCRYHCAVGPPTHCGSIQDRLKQKYLMVPDVAQKIALKLMDASMQHDHLGAFLTRLLLDEPMESAAAVEFDFQNQRAL